MTDRSVSEVIRTLSRWVLGIGLIGAGLGHLTWSRTEFQAQVPDWVPFSKDLVVVLSGVVELALGALLLVVPERRRPQLGLVVAAFFVAVFPGNISQFVTHTDAFGLNSDAERAIRLLFQPVLVGWAILSTRTPGRGPSATGASSASGHDAF